MNVKELLIIVLLVLCTTWGLDYLLFNKKGAEDLEVKSGQSFVAPKGTHKIEPLKTEVDFDDAQIHQAPILTHVDTCYAHFTFSTEGASLEALEFKPYQYYGMHQSIVTLAGVQNKDKRCFLVALSEKTPYYYTLVEKKDVEKAVELVYQAETDVCTVIKKFTIDTAVCKIILSVTLIPKDGKEHQARVLFVAPRMVKVEDVTGAMVSNEQGRLTLMPRKNINSDMYWFAPSLFGVDDRYFVLAMVDDPAHFTQRAYYLLTGQQEITSILEGPQSAQEAQWELTFYCGPKDERAMACVDTRLHQALGYAGWFSYIAKLLLKLLNYLYSYLGNYGLAIIALTIITKIVLLPFSLKGSQSIKKQNEVQRKLKYLQQKYKDDPEMLAQERADLMRKEGLSSMAGCLPLLIQLPIFFALSRVFSTALELYGAPFLWIKDLSAIDPYYILPLLTGATMIIQATLVDPKQRVQLLIMALVFGAITASLAAGLVLYIFMSTLLGIIQSLVQQTLKMA